MRDSPFLPLFSLFLAANEKKRDHIAFNQSANKSLKLAYY